MSTGKPNEIWVVEEGKEGEEVWLPTVFTFMDEAKADDYVSFLREHKASHEGHHLEFKGLKYRARKYVPAGEG